MTTTTPSPDATTAYTDGACIGNPGPGGWAWAVPGGAFASGSAAATTNQRMEVQAALEAIRAIEGPLRIVSDSKYVVDCFNQRWYDGWERRDWKNAKKELNDVPLVQQRVKLRSGANSFTFTVPEKPLAVVIDPDHLFFDRLPEDNRKKVEVK